MNVRLLTAALILSTAVPAFAAPSKEEDAVKARVAEFIGVFNKGDAKAIAAFWTEDGTLVNPAGKAGKNRAEVEQVIATDLATILKGTQMEMTVVGFRAIGKDAAWIDIDHVVKGAHAPDGSAMPTMTFHVPALMLKKGKTWMIADARPYAFLMPPPPKTAAK